MAQDLLVVFMLRVANIAARPCTPTSSTAGKVLKKALSEPSDESTITEKIL